MSFISHFALTSERILTDKTHPNVSLSHKTVGKTHHDKIPPHCNATSHQSRHDTKYRHKALTHLNVRRVQVLSRSETHTLPITGLTSELSESLRHLLMFLRRHVFAQHLDQLAGRLQVSFNVRQLGQQSLRSAAFCR